MISTASLRPTTFVQPFDQTYGTKTWIPRRKLIEANTNFRISTFKAEGAHGIRRKGGGRHVHLLAATRCFVKLAIESETSPQEAITESEPSPNNRIDNLEVLPSTRLDAVTGKHLEKGDEKLKQSSSRRLLEDKDLVAGAVVTGKVKGIVSFGAFVDIGAFIDGLVHISRLGSGYAMFVEDVVSVGQEVRVKILDVNFASKRISLSMKDIEDGGQQKPPTPESSLRGGLGQRQGGGIGNNRQKADTSLGQGQIEQRKSSEFQKGEQINGVVKNLTKRGAFVRLPGGEEGFLHIREIPGAERMPLQNLVSVGKEVNVRVLKVEGGRINLSLKPLLDLANVNKAGNSDIQIGANAFEIAFRSNPEIRKYLDAREAKVSHLVEELLPLDPTATQDDIFRRDWNMPLIADECPADDKRLDVSASANCLADKIYEENAVVVDEGESVQAKERVSLNGTGGIEAYAAVIDKAERVQAQERIPLDPTGDIKNAVVVNKTEIVQANEEILLDATGDIEEDTVVVDKSLILQEKEGVPPDGAGDIDKYAVVIDKAEKVQDRESVLLNRTRDIEENAVIADKKEKMQVKLRIPWNGTRDIEENAVVVEKAEKGQEKKRILLGETSDMEETAVVVDKAEKVQEKERGPLNETRDILASPNIISSSAEENPAVVEPAERVQEKQRVALDVTSVVEENAVIVDKAEKVQEKERGPLDGTRDIATSAKDIIPSFHEENSLCLQDIAVKDGINEARRKVAADEEAITETEHEIQLVIEGTTAVTEEKFSNPAKSITSNVNEAIEPFAVVKAATNRPKLLDSEAAVERSTAFPGMGLTMLLPSLSFGAQKTATSSILAASILSSAAVGGLKEEPKLESSEGSATITSALIRELRSRTGAGLMMCKKALVETKGDLEEAMDYLCRNGLASAENKVGQIVAEGLIGNYVHDGRIGVLIEVNCETDFVSRGSIFKQLVEDLAMQVVASQQVKYVSIEDIPLEIQAKERELEMQREGLLSKPGEIQAKIVDGRLAKRFGELALLEQPFIKNDTILVRDLVKQTIARVGENIHIRRFMRYTLGEKLERE